MSINLKIILIVGMLTLIYTEVVVYWLNQLTWPQFNDNSDEIRILLIADPQIIGNNNDPW
jgi:hypothetical protein